jgi:hypothetical protein
MHCQLNKPTNWNQPIKQRRSGWINRRTVYIMSWRAALKSQAPSSCKSIGISHDGHLKGFRASEEFKHFYKDVAPFMPFIAEMRHSDITSVNRNLKSGVA